MTHRFSFASSLLCLNLSLCTIDELSSFLSRSDIRILFKYVGDDGSLCVCYEVIINE